MSDAASAKADDGGIRWRSRNVESMVEIRAARWWLKSLGPRWPPASKSNTARVRNIWCSRAQDVLEARPHQRELPCSRRESRLDGSDTADRALMSTQSLKRLCGRAPLSSSCIVPTAMAAQRTAMFRAMVSETRFGARSVGGTQPSTVGRG
eukprot:6186871-Pleurochrysis_carterae.AAC.2